MTLLIEKILFAIANWLYVPVYFGLILMVFWVAWSFGEFIFESFQVSKRSKVNTFFRDHNKFINSSLINSDQADIELTELIQSWEKNENAKLDRIRAIIKIGPSLGLVGTLIPMGQALSTLSNGDMNAMAKHMTTAFTATIIGLVCGIIAYMITLKKEQWLSKDFLACEAKLEKLLREENYEAIK
jgi:biopolymer transport protein ExbB/TolQ